MLVRLLKRQVRIGIRISYQSQMLFLKIIQDYMVFLIQRKFICTHIFYMTHFMLSLKHRKVISRVD